MNQDDLAIDCTSCRQTAILVCTLSFTIVLSAVTLASKSDPGQLLLWENYQRDDDQGTARKQLLSLDNTSNLHGEERAMNESFPMQPSPGDALAFDESASKQQLSTNKLANLHRMERAMNESFPMQPSSGNALALDESASKQQPSPNMLADLHGMERAMHESFPMPPSSGDTTWAFNESEGFFEEQDDRWMFRKRVYVGLMHEEDSHQKECSTWNGPIMPFWERCYQPSIRCTLEERIGQSGDGGKWVCDPLKISAKVLAGKGCLVYSIGSNGDYGFEVGVLQSISANCEIRIIDRKNWTDYTNSSPPAHTKYHVYTIGQPPGGTPVSTVVKDLNHVGRIIDIFKIDCEGCEWSTYKSWFGSDVYIRQILVELHAFEVTSRFMQDMHDFFNFLFDLGYVIFHKEPNMLFVTKIFMCVEFGFLKLSPSFSRRVLPDTGKAIPVFSDLSLGKELPKSALPTEAFQRGKFARGQNRVTRKR